ncbi:MAG: glycerophosphodiester phosphodiesterase [Flavobacteriales bacterium]|nr:MAG: glycerophosphodiester phosphodiesterase [Flavobacteriales bacterium]
MLTLPLLNTNAFCMLLLTLAWNCKSDAQPMSSQFENLTVIAHRGASGSAPENTLASIKKAMETGANMIEIDVHLSKDDTVVLMHDSKVDRTTNGTGKVQELTLEELKKLDAGSWFNEKFSSEKIPTLEEVLKAINGKCKLLIEVKGKSKTYQGIEKQIVDLINKYNAKNWCIVQSFHTPYIENTYRLDSAIEVHKLIISPLRLFPFIYMDDGLRFGSIKKFTYAKSINPNHKAVSKKFIKKIHSQNQTVFCWTVNEKETAKKLIALGVDGIITNYPEKFLKK